MLVEVVIQRVHLVHGARKAVEQEATLGVRLVESIRHDLLGELVGHEIAGLHDGVHLLAQRGAILHIVAEHVSG